MIFKGPTNEYFEVNTFRDLNRLHDTEQAEDWLTTIWFQEDDNIIKIDGAKKEIKAYELVCLTSFQKVEFIQTGKAHVIRFNSPFYCILNHDSEVGCKGLLFFGSRNVPIISPSDEDLKVFQTVWQMLELEMSERDNLQLEMLQMMLKRWLILCARIYKKQNNYDELETGQVDIVREYNFLVESYFKTKHTVGEYAELLNKSPKTLSNLFKKLHSKSPLQVIQNRIMLEARRLIRYTDQNVSEIGYELGFNDVQSFSRFFKKHEGCSPTEFKTLKVA